MRCERKGDVAVEGIKVLSNILRQLLGKISKSEKQVYFRWWLGIRPLFLVSEVLHLASLHASTNQLYPVLSIYT